MALDEISEMVRDGNPLHIVTGLDFRRYLSRHVVGPMLKGVEGDHPDWVIELAGQKIGDGRFEVHPLDLGLAV
jgi:hypothetical protein